MENDWLSVPFTLAGKRVFVAGETGMVGSALVRRLQSENVQLISAPREALDLRDQVAVGAWMARNRPEVVVLCAARVGGILDNALHPADFFYDNMMITVNVIHAAYQAGVGRLLYLGSSCIYPQDAAQPMAEDSLLGGALEPTNEAYALAKIAGVKMAAYYRAQYGCDFISAMPCNLYGPGDRYDATRSHVIPALILKAHAAKFAGAPLRVWGSGQALREFLYVDDLADALVFLLKHYSGAGPVNVGSGVETPISELAEKIADCVGCKGWVEFDTTKPEGVLRKVMDSSRIFSAGWRPATSLDDGLKRAYADYLARGAHDLAA
ncbi:MAG: GDP-L-fucose synthase [Alphaproteobacteria bacterium]|nr:GDP-L-fucose synthase [Alphaproteobacteria bacterium]